MKSKNLSEKILRLIKSKGFNNIELDPVLETKYILQRSGENFRKFILDNYSTESVGKKLEKIIDSMEKPNYDFKFSTSDINPEYIPPEITDLKYWIKDLYKNIKS